MHKPFLSVYQKSRISVIVCHKLQKKMRRRTECIKYHPFHATLCYMRIPKKENQSSYLLQATGENT